MKTERDLLEAHTCMVPWDSAIVYSDYYDEEVIRIWHIMERFWTDWNTESEIAEFFGHQRSRMNMASIRGILARVYSYAGRERKRTMPSRRHSQWAIVETVDLRTWTGLSRVWSPVE